MRVQTIVTSRCGSSLPHAIERRREALYACTAFSVKPTSVVIRAPSLNGFGSAMARSPLHRVVVSSSRGIALEFPPKPSRSPACANRWPRAGGRQQWSYKGCGNCQYPIFGQHWRAHCVVVSRLCGLATRHVSRLALHPNPAPNCPG